LRFIRVFLVRETFFKNVKGITYGVKRRIWAKRMRKPDRSGKLKRACVSDPN
jgi:hypothetical protein